MRWVVALLCVTALAGCAESTDDPGDMPTPDPDAPVELTTGFLRGVVFDPAIRPIEFVEVTIMQGGNEVAILTTDADGNWGVGDLEAGSYDVRAYKPGFERVNVTGDVIAGDQTPEPIEIMLTPVPIDDSFIWPIVWEGTVTCGTTLQNWCAATNFVAGAEVFSDDSFRFLFDDFMAYERTPDFLQAEFVWEPNTAISNWAYSAFWASTWAEWEECLCTPNLIGVVEGDGYMLVQADRAPLEELDVGFSRGIGVGFSAGSTSPDDPSKFTVMINQPFEAYFHVFYGCVPPEGWLFTVDGEPECDPDVTRPAIPYEITQRSD